MIDSNLNDARDFLVSVVEDKSSNARSRELSIKIVFLLGVARSNVEDFFLVSTLVDQYKIDVDLREEFMLLKDDDEESSTEIESTKKNIFVNSEITKSGTLFYLKGGNYAR